MSALDLDLLRRVNLTAFDLNVIRTLVKTGGETGLFPGSMKPESRAFLAITVDKGLVTATGADGKPVDVTTTTDRIELRFTTLGRKAAEQDEVAMRGAKDPTVRA